MTDLDRELRDRLDDLPLPAAPETLHVALDRVVLETPTREHRRRATSRRPLILLAAAVLLLPLVGGVLTLSASNPPPNPPIPLPSTADVTPASPTAGFTRPGFAFDPPSGWTDQTAVVSFPTIPQYRFVAYLVRGMTSCPTGYGSPPPKPAGCEEGPTRPGTATLAITEMNDQYPWLLNTIGPGTSIAGYPTVSKQGDTETTWYIQSPDNGIYQITLNSPKDEMADNVAVVSRALDSLKLTSWEQPRSAINGLIHEDPGQGFTFDYPSGWVRYYPTDVSTRGHAVVTVASSPLLPPCKNDSHPQASNATPPPACGSFTLPAGTVAVAFDVGAVPTAPDWSGAETTIGGQPAFGPETWGPQNAAGAEQGYSWSVRMQDPEGRQVLDIAAGVNGPGSTELRAAMNQVLESIKITPP